MARARQYIIRGSLRKCLNRMFTWWASNQVEYLTLLYNERCRTYAVVDDDFIDKDEPEPGTPGLRLVLRVNLKELKSLCTYYSTTQTKLGI